MSRQKRELYDELIQEVRRSQGATQRFDDAVAAALGINTTDMRCLDVLQREGPRTAGQLAQATGLSSGAMTTAIDRLERRGMARRVRDGQDRRRVLVEMAPGAAQLNDFFREHQEYAERLYERHTAADLELLLRFVREGREFNERRASEVEAETRRGR